MPTPEKNGKPRRRARGTGSIRKDKARGVWVGRVPVGKLPGGQTRYRQVSHRDHAECVRLMAGVGRVIARVTVAEWSVRWLESVSHREPQTRDNYRRSVKYRINPLLGHYRLAELTTFDCEQAIARWQTKLAPNSVLLAVQHLSSLCQSAVRAGLLDRNPVRAAHRPRAVRKPIQPFTARELRRIIRFASDAPRTRPIAVLAGTGCRMGELLALDAGDYNASTGMLSITKGDRMRYGIGPTKTRNSVRSIRVPEEAQGAASAAKGGRIRGPLWVAQGKRQTRHQMNRDWRWVLQACGLAYRSPHVARHSVGSLMIAAGASLADVAKYLGDSVQVVVKTYLHATGSDPSAVLDRALVGVKPALAAVAGKGEKRA